MPRYIDADALLQKLPDDLPYKASVKRVLTQAPSAEVTPLPCKIGDTVWIIRKYNGIPQARKGKVSEMYFNEGMRLTIVVKGIARGEWGKTVFASEEEAIKKIKGEEDYGD